MTDRVYVHIGAYKTGTTYLQHRLWANRQELAAHGVLFPGWRGWGDQVRAFKHVLDRPEHRGQPMPAQPWRRLCGAIREWDGPTAVLSYEGLSVAADNQARRIVEELAPAEVHVVVTARDLVRVIPAMWQEVLQGGQTWSWSQYATTVTGALGRTVPPGRAFWRSHDLVRVIRPWADATAVERVHIVTVPPSGSPPAVLWERFCRAIGTDPSIASTEPARINESLDPPSTELMRRINVAVEGRMDRDVYDRVLKGFVAKDVLAASASAERVGLAPDQVEWARERGRAMTAELARLGYPVEGDLDDLVGVASSRSAGAATVEQTLDAAVLVIDALARRVHANGPGARRGGRRDVEDEEPPAAPGGDATEPSSPSRKVGSTQASRLVRQAYDKLRR